MLFFYPLLFFHIPLSLHCKGHFTITFNSMDMIWDNYLSFMKVQTILTILSSVLAFLYFAISVLGIVLAVMLGSLLSPALVPLALGLAGIIFAVLGIIGSRFDPETKSTNAICLILFYIVEIVFAAVFILVAALCMTIRPALDALILACSDAQVKKTVLDLLSIDDISELPGKLDTLDGMLLGVAIVAMVITVVSVVTILITSVRLGSTTFRRV